MAEDGNGKDSGKATSQNNLSGRPEPARTPRWSETCIGVWSRSVISSSDGKEDRNLVCTGINVIKIKDLDPAKVKPSQTRGIQVILNEKSLVNKLDAPSSPNLQNKSSSARLERDNFTESFSLSQHLYGLYNTKKANVEDRWRRYSSNPADMTEMYHELKDASISYYESSKRILAYLKPIEKLYQMKTFAISHAKDVERWLESSRK